MEHQETYLQRPTTPKSSTSAIDLTGTPAGIVSSAPPSPSLEPSDSKSSFSRRRTSWGQRLVEEGQDPLRLDPFEPSNSATLSSSGLSSGARPVLPSVDDIFLSPTDDRSFPFSARYGSQQHNMSVYSNSQAGPSTASLITPREFGSEEGHREDDEAHLTANMSRNGTDERWEEDYSADPERMTPRSRRRTVRYSVSPSPLKKTGTAIKSMSHNIRRASIRVVNLASAGLENQLRLGDDDISRGKRSDDGDEEPLPDLTKALPIRGRTLGCLGPESKVRIALFNFLVYSYVSSLSWRSCTNKSLTVGRNLLYLS